MAVQGAGTVSTEHLRAYLKNPHCRVVAIGSRTKEGAAAKARQVGLDPGEHRHLRHDRRSAGASGPGRPLDLHAARPARPGDDRRGPGRQARPDREAGRDEPGRPARDGRCRTRGRRAERRRLRAALEPADPGGEGDAGRRAVRRPDLRPGRLLAQRRGLRLPGRGRPALARHHRRDARRAAATPSTWRAT